MGRRVSCAQAWPRVEVTDGDPGVGKWLGSWCGRKQCMMEVVFLSLDESLSNAQAFKELDPMITEAGK
jgi:hypothetical protein